MPTANDLKLKKQSSEESFAHKMKSASDTQYTKDTMYNVFHVDTNSGQPVRQMTLDEFTAWAGAAARMYILQEVAHETTAT